MLTFNSLSNVEALSGHLVYNFINLLECASVLHTFLPYPQMPFIEGLDRKFSASVSSVAVASVASITFDNVMQAQG